MKSLDWMDEALCGGEATEVFFPRFVGLEPHALAYCAACPVEMQCLEYGLGVEGKLMTGAARFEGGMGVFGGTVPADRVRAARRAARKVAS